MEFLNAISHPQNDGLPPPFMEMLSKLQVQGDKADSGEEGLLKMMEGMMSTLLSREVLYPSLQDLVSQVRKKEKLTCLADGMIISPCEGR